MAAAIVSGVLVALLSASLESQERPAGYVKVATGTVLIARGGIDVPAHPGAAVYEKDELRTGADGRLGITLKDDTRVSLGPNSEIGLSEFKFSPELGQLGLVMKLVRGVAAFVSGRIVTLRSDGMRIETPSTIVGVRGSHFVIRAGTP